MRPGTAEPPPTLHADADDFVRLHITPLDSDLLNVVLPASVLPKARNISFHTLEAFPEKRYGFVELPLMEADKLKKKLHGSVLKGSKVKVEKARPSDAVTPTAQDDADDVPEKKKKKKSKKYTDDAEGTKKRKRDLDVLEGVSLNGRKVKRGWTEPVELRKKRKSKKSDEPQEQEKRKRTKSKYTDQEECLLKTRVPPNLTANLPQEDGGKKKKKKGKGREVTVHEFEKTTKFPSFLKNDAPVTSGKPAVEFVEGTGWVDEDGTVVEAVEVKVKPAVPEKPAAAVAEPAVEEEEDSDDDTSSSGTSSEESDDDAESESEETSPTDANKSSPLAKPQITGLPSIKTDLSTSRPISSSSSKSLTIKIPPPITPAKVHPLEALYKRVRPAEGSPTAGDQAGPAEEQPFSFFGAGDGEDHDEPLPTQTPMGVPMTPFTRQEFEWRTVRSAAPTPDTAHPSRRHFWASHDDEQEDDDEKEDAVHDEVMASTEGNAVEDDDEEDGDDAVTAPQGQAGSSDFQKFFWDNRRELNRSWMKRRKTAAKEKRHRENKARASKAV
ncbi:hypothetical protein S40293_00710 [Stachybotrys chartarum IBT 40293]|nr:hypothetical protein S40293_00710 [Stachybotrys chartarum IBT 40293]